MHSFEIEMKVLLGEEKNAKALIEKLYQADDQTKLLEKNSQLNHYFLVNGNMETVIAELKTHIHPDHHAKLEDVLLKGKKHSIRSREIDGKVLFIVKASIDDTTSSNGTARIEFEEEAGDLSLEALDAIMLKHGFTYQSKWSRKREEYSYKGMKVCIDKNAGYGYVAEFEKMIQDKELAEQTKEDIRKEMSLLGVEELDQARLERMFAFYNEHWPEYYGSEKTFIIE